MGMDPGLRELSTVMSSGMKFDDFINHNGFKRGEFFPSMDQNLMNLPIDSPDRNPDLNCDLMPSSGVSPEGNSPEDLEVFSDMALQYIREMLLEEDLDDLSPVYEESPALQAAQRRFAEILGGSYPLLPHQQHPLYIDHDAGSPENHVDVGGFTSFSSGFSSSSSSNSSNADGGCVLDAGEYLSLQNLPAFSSDYKSRLSGSLNPYSNVVDGLGDFSVSEVEVSNFFGENESVSQFQKGVEEASKFLPSNVNLVVDLDKIDLEKNELLNRELKEEFSELKVKVEKKDDSDYVGNGSRGKKNPLSDNFELEEGRSNKQTAIYQEETVRSELFDMVLLCGEGKCGSALSDLQLMLQNGVSKNSQMELSKGSNGNGKSRGKRLGRREVVDMRTLLIQCAQSVASDDRRTAVELLKQVRQHSDPFGDGSQRLGHYFANALEARMAGTGSQKYMEFVNKRTKAADILKAYHLFLAACPFKRILHFYANQTILDSVENATRIHIVDFGINYGFQWPCFLQRLGGRAGGPPFVRITGIDQPQPGFRPADRIEETGRRLADYAQSFNVPFEFASIASSKWETIQVEDLKIKGDEVLIVNCLYQFHMLADETLVIDSPRDLVLKTIRKMNPDVFIHGVVNGAYSAPFFITRFREALFHWSALFDMLEANVPREEPERILIEREFFGRQAMNVVACEGAERVERPETYKQWQVRTTRAGFSQLPLNQNILKKARVKVRCCYHKDFVIDEDSQWLLQGWKGRIIFAISSWRPNDVHV